MLELFIPETEEWDEFNQQFIHTNETKLRLEHSLVSISKWESYYQKPFLSKENKTAEETLYYVKCMTITQNVDPNVYSCLNAEHIRLINEYIKSPMSATTFSDKNNRPSRETITAELIYYWMIALNIPFECQKWHLNKLLTLVKICSIKNQPDKKMGKNQVMRNNTALNAARRQRLHSKG